MTLFLLTFFLVYGSFHFYAFSRAQKALSFGGKAGVLLAFFMLIMILAPFLVRLCEKAGYDLLARALSYVGYMWLGVIFLFVSFAFAVDIVRVTVHVAGSLTGNGLSFLKLSDMFAFYAPLTCAVIISVFGYFSALDIRLEKRVLNTDKLPASMEKLTIVQISDVHLGLIVRQERLKRILDMAKQAAPDILVSTGDLVDGQINRLDGLAEMLKKINPPFGKYAITGNHEFYAGLSQALKFTRDSGFTLLRGEAVTAGGIINIAGVDDPAGEYFKTEKHISEAGLLSSLPPGNFTLLLKHRPLVNGDSLGHFDLQLSGHTHKGQIFPFNIVTWLYYPVHAGFVNPVDDSYLYVSRGSGTWGPPVRFLSPPEVTVFEIRRKLK